jgi:hypothetical protein
MSPRCPKSGKRRFASYGDALAALIALEERSPREGVRSAYQCEVCGDWHISHKLLALVKPRGCGKRRKRMEYHAGL